MKKKLEKWSKLNPETGCIEWTGGLVNGYGSTNVKGADGKKITKRAHRVSYEEYVGKIPEGLHVCHKCDNRKCINPEHLFAGTNLDNVRDRDRKGRGSQPSGESHNSAKLTDKKIILIRQLRRFGFAQQVIADTFGVHQMTISRIVNRKIWRHVK